MLKKTPMAEINYSPTVQEFSSALIQVNLTALQKRMLAIHAAAPSQTLTATELARQAGYSSKETANAQYGRLGRKLGAVLNQNINFEFPVEYLVDFGNNEQRQITWILRPALTEAVKQLGLSPIADVDVNHKERAARAWPILTQTAVKRETISYGELGSHLGIHHRAVRFVLAEIQDYCLGEKLPPITILVIGKGGKPGTGFIAWDVDDLDRGFEKVYNYSWENLENPFEFASHGTSIESLADGVFRQIITPKDAYARVKVRGMAQPVFRETLLKAYEGQCAVSNVFSPELLEAAHIIPWSKARVDQRINPRNGLLLSTIYHRFFDLGWMQIEEDYTISTDCSSTRVDSFERGLLDAVRGTKLRLPADRQHWPDPELIRERKEMT